MGLVLLRASSRTTAPTLTDRRCSGSHKWTRSLQLCRFAVLAISVTAERVSCVDVCSVLCGTVLVCSGCWLCETSNIYPCLFLCVGIRPRLCCLLRSVEAESSSPNRPHRKISARVAHYSQTICCDQGCVLQVHEGRRRQGTGRLFGSLKKT